MNELLTMLESKYKRLEYIQSTGTQWIDTGIIRNSLNKWRFKGSINFQDVTTRQIMGVGSVVYFGCVNGYWQIGQTGTGNTGKTIQINTDNVFDIEINSTNNTYNATINGENISGLTGPNGTQNYNLLLFNVGGATGFYCSCKLKYLQIYKDDTLVRNFIPVMRKSDNEIGMLDLVEGKFYPNAGTGKFTANLDTMYAIIKGTPTVQDGRVSNFSSSNYLQSNSIIPNNKNIETVIKFKISENNRLNPIFNTSDNRTSIKIRSDNNCVGITAFDENEEYFNNSGSTVVNINQYYYMKIVINSNTIIIYLSGDGINYTQEITHSFSMRENNKIRFGIQTPNDYLIGSIDLNRSYIKIDDTKYKLQAVVGYTKVGSPTITYGVLSNLSSGNGIQVSKVIGNDWETLEFNTELSLSSLGSGHYGAFFGDSSYLLFREESYKFSIWYRINGSYNWNHQTINYTISENTLYKLNLLIKKSTGLFIFTLSQYNNILASINFVDIENIPNFVNKEYYGKILGDFTVEQINLNNTYIKINNKLWFNGLEA